MLISAIIGFAIPVVFTAVFAAFDFMHFFPPDFLIPFDQWEFYLWPTSIGLLALDGSPNWSAGSLSWTLLLAVLNVPIYIFIGTLIRVVIELLLKLWVPVSRNRNES